MRIFDHFGHLAHGHAGAWIGVAIAMFVAIGMSMWVVFSNHKGPDA